MYVNYYDRFVKEGFEHPTIGILLCTAENDAVVRITLPEENKTVLASQYQLYLPSEETLADEVSKELRRFEGEERPSD